VSNAQAISPEQAINVPDDNPAKGLSKGAAFGIHLALSLLIFSSLIAMMLLFWFPGKLFFLDGGWEGLGGGLL